MLKGVLFLWMAVMLPATTVAQPWKVMKVLAGDKLIVSSQGLSELYTLYGVDCPEMDQPYGPVARDWLAGFLSDRSIRVETVTLGSWGHPLVKIYVNDLCVNEILLKKGLAWVNTYYCESLFCYQWKKLEERARQEGKGLWHRASPVPPWEWRREDYRKEGAAGS